MSFRKPVPSLKADDDKGQSRQQSRNEQNPESCFQEGQGQCKQMYQELGKNCGSEVSNQDCGKLFRTMPDTVRAVDQHRDADR